MQYFDQYSDVLYKFGKEESTVAFQDLSTYVDLIDEIKNTVSVYEKESILDGDRPDQLSQKLYGTPAYHWTFYLMNDNLRLQGWPLSHEELEVKVKKVFPNIVITTRNNLKGIFKVGQTVTGAQSGSSGKIIHRNLSLGQLVINGDAKFTAGETVQSVIPDVGGDITQSITCVSSEEEYNAAHHYENASKEIVDIGYDSSNGNLLAPGAQLTEITNYEHYIAENDKLKNIKVIRADIIDDVVASYRQAVS